MDTIAQVLCFLCVSTASVPYPQISTPWHDIRYTHELLGQGRHLLRLSTTDMIVDWNRFRKDRLHDFAVRFAEETCQGPFRLADADRASWPKTRPTFAKNYLFKCG